MIFEYTKPSWYLREAIRHLYSPRTGHYRGCCRALLYARAPKQAWEYMYIFYDDSCLNAYWFGAPTKENYGVRILALGFAAAIAESEGN